MDRRISQTKWDYTNVGYGYERQCTRCLDTDRCMYIGETSRTAYTRTREHVNNYRGNAAAKFPALPEPGIGNNESLNLELRTDAI